MTQPPAMTPAQALEIVTQVLLHPTVKVSIPEANHIQNALVVLRDAIAPQTNHEPKTKATKKPEPSGRVEAIAAPE